MKSSPASSASLASARQSGQLADQRSGTLVAERPDEQLAPNNPIFSALPLYMAILFLSEAAGASIAFLPVLSRFLARLAFDRGQGNLPIPYFLHGINPLRECLEGVRPNPRMAF